ncbi:MAG TPA: HlyD family efflux transporter periplasmic adaptor subunit [Luteibaculaceae bacterium]|nr:HlyD family efflux transporter periplasmic adaptor subunit [Luteibaculaceae bacterium]
MPNHNSEDELSLRGEGVHEILSYEPGKMIRYGNMAILLIIALLLIGTWFIKYPEIITSSVSVTGQSPTIEHIAQSAGQLKLFVKNNQEVKKGTLLALIDNASSFEDVRYLRDMLDSQTEILATQEADVVLDFDRPLLLGDLQSDFSSLKSQYNTWRSFVADDFYPRKIRALANQYQYYLQLNQKLGSQQDVLTKDLEIAKRKYNRDRKLFEAKVIAQAEMDRSEADFLQKEFAFKNTEITQVNNEIQLREYEKSMLDVEQQYKDLRRQYAIAFVESFKKMQSAINAWEQRFVIEASSNGKVALYNYFADNQFVKPGDEILRVVPKSRDLVARCFVPAFGLGKIELGQRVNIKLDGYPFKEFGMLEGRVKSISPSAKNNLYLVEVSLPNPPVTTYKKKLNFNNEMSGTAEIITADLRLLERLFYQIRSVIKK